MIIFSRRNQIKLKWFVFIGKSFFKPRKHSAYTDKRNDAKRLLRDVNSEKKY